MKESRISLLLLISLSLLLLAIVVLFIGGLAFYKQSIEVADHNKPSVKTAVTRRATNTDSLQAVYNSSIVKLNTELDSTRNQVDSFQQKMDSRLNEFNSLKNEIAGILQKNPASSPDILVARQKIEELRLRLAEWRLKYADVDEENKRLNNLLQQFGRQAKQSEQATLPKTSEVKSVTDKNASASLIISGVQLKAIMQLDDREQETNQALQTDELKGSFDLKTGATAISAAEMFIVILQPDGKVMKRSSWESGSFDTKDGRKVYSQKLTLDFNKTESKHLNFSIAADEYQKGSYVFQLYHNGKIIASTSKRLS